MHEAIPPARPAALLPVEAHPVVGHQEADPVGTELEADDDLLGPSVAQGVLDRLLGDAKKGRLLLGLEAGPLIVVVEVDLGPAGPRLNPLQKAAERGDQPQIV